MSCFKSCRAELARLFHVCNVSNGRTTLPTWDTTNFLIFRELFRSLLHFLCLNLANVVLQCGLSVTIDYAVSSHAFVVLVSTWSREFSAVVFSVRPNKLQWSFIVCFLKSVQCPYPEHSLIISADVTLHPITGSNVSHKTMCRTLANNLRLFFVGLVLNLRQPHL